MREREDMTIRSFRVVFDLERRIHRIDRWRVPVPYGVPLRGVAYWAVALLAVVLFARVPVGGDLAGNLPPPIRLVIFPIAIAYVLARVQLDGRPAHAALVSWVRFRLAPSRLAGFRGVPRPGAVLRLNDVAFLPDERCARYRHAVIEGPATVLLRYPAFGSVRGAGRRPRLHVTQIPGPALFVGKQVRLNGRQRMVLHR
jgi:hypothetical protein